MLNLNSLSFFRYFKERSLNKWLDSSELWPQQIHIDMHTQKENVTCHISHTHIVFEADTGWHLN